MAVPIIWTTQRLIPNYSHTLTNLGMNEQVRTVWNIGQEDSRIQTTETIKTRWQVLDWGFLAQGMAKWLPFINTGTNIRFA